EGLAGKRVLDLGCGWGRVALALAPEAGAVVGLDRDHAAIGEARKRASEAPLDNAGVPEADLRRAEYSRFCPDLITAHLRFADAIIERAGRALESGGALGMVAFHVDQWRETGKASRFAYDESRMAALLRASALEPDAIEVEREIRSFQSVEEGLAVAVGLEDR